MITEEQVKVKSHIVYRGMRDGGYVEVRANEKPLRVRYDLLNYAEKFNWGGDNHEVAQLALAILADALEDDAAAKAAHVDFKFEVLSRLAHDEWAVDCESIIHWFSDWYKNNSPAPCNTNG
jgi:hypothetical protein